MNRSRWLPMATHPHRFCRTHASAGFSLVEIIVATGLLVVVATGSAMLFILSNRQAVASRGRQEQQSAISDDIATIQRLNDRYSCTSGTCAVYASDPGEDYYYPSGSGANSSFDTLCRNGGLLTNLITAINSTATPSNFSALGITRQTPVIDSEDLSTHRYTITWVNSSSRALRQITLVPTVANWCP